MNVLWEQEAARKAKTAKKTYKGLFVAKKFDRFLKKSHKGQNMVGGTGLSPICDKPAESDKVASMQWTPDVAPDLG